MEEKRITWHLDEGDICYAENKEGEELGVLCYEQVGRHWHWCWYQKTDIRMSPGCLQEVRNKQKELFNNRRG